MVPTTGLYQTGGPGNMLKGAHQIIPVFYILDFLQPVDINPKKSFKKDLHILMFLVKILIRKINFQQVQLVY